MVLLRRKAVLAAKIEATAGTPETIAQADVISMAYEPTVQFNAPVNPRNKMSGFGQFQQVPGLRTGTATFRIDLVGNGSGTVPPWAELLLPACGMGKIANTFFPYSEVPGTTVKTLTIVLYQDGRAKQMAGAAGTFVINYETGMPCSIDFVFTGKVMDPSVIDVAMLTDPATPRIPHRFADASFSIGSWTPCVQSVAVDIGNNVIARECQNAASGISTGLITDRLPTMSVNPEAPLVAEYAVYQKWWDMAEETISISTVDDADQITTSFNQAQLQNVQDGDRNGILIDDLTYQANQDSLSIAFATKPAQQQGENVTTTNDD